MVVTSVERNIFNEMRIHENFKTHSRVVVRFDVINHKDIIEFVPLQLCYYYFVPGQAASSHASVDVDSPTQSAPDPDGAGAVHVLVRDLVPSPQLAVQSVQEPHSDQPPSTPGASIKLVKTQIISCTI